MSAPILRLSAANSNNKSISSIAIYNDMSTLASYGNEAWRSICNVVHNILQYTHAVGIVVIVVISLDRRHNILICTSISARDIIFKY